MVDALEAERRVNYLTLHADVRALTLLVDWLLLREALSRPDPAAVVDEIEEAVRPGVEAPFLPSGAPVDVEDRFRARLRAALSEIVDRLRISVELF